MWGNPNSNQKMSGFGDGSMGGRLSRPDVTSLRLAIASLAQLVEQVTLNHRVGGSSPSRRTLLVLVTTIKSRRKFLYLFSFRFV